MATIVGSICTSHVPAIGRAIAQNLQQEAYWKPFFDGFPPVREWLNKIKPDVAVVFYNDHGLNFFLNNVPTFAVGAAPEYRNEDEGWGIPALGSFPGDPELSWHIINSLVADEFDISTCQEMLVDHAFSLPMKLLWEGKDHDWPVKTVPIAINTVQHPMPSAKRCLALGRAVGKAIESFPKDLKVVVIGTGGLSHQLDGQRAGFINKEFDKLCLDNLIDNPDALTKYNAVELVELAGTQGVEVVMWIAARGALLGDVREVHRNYHIPISNTAAGLQLLENKPKVRELQRRVG
jgi:protocatechuate 4,5-dioxygenase, beta chain